MRSVRLARSLLLLLLAVFASAALAHHSWSRYDQTQPIGLSGTVVELNFFNPHVTLTVQATGGTWLVVLGSPYRMQKLGLTSAALKPGTKITVTGYPHRTEADTMRAERIVVDERTVNLR
jgi:hypothetical protein